MKKKKKKMEKWSKYNEVRQKSNTSIKMCHACRGRLVYAGESAIVTAGLTARHLNVKEKPDIKCTLSSILEETDAQNYGMGNEGRMKT